MPLLSRQPELIAQHLKRPRDRSSTEHVFVTVWDDVESIQSFAGDRWQEAAVASDEEHLLKRTWIEHYDVIPVPSSET